MSEVPELHDKLLDHMSPDQHLCQDIGKSMNIVSVLENNYLIDLIKIKKKELCYAKTKDHTVLITLSPLVLFQLQQARGRYQSFICIISEINNSHPDNYF